MGLLQRKRQRTRKCQVGAHNMDHGLFGTPNRQTEPSPAPQSKSPCTNSPPPMSLRHAMCLLSTPSRQHPCCGPFFDFGTLGGKTPDAYNEDKEAEEDDKKRQESCTNAIFLKRRRRKSFHMRGASSGAVGMGSCA